MSRMSTGLSLGLFALASTSFGQNVQFNFTSYQIDNFYAQQVNRSGAMLGTFDNGTSSAISVWTASQGLQNITQQAGDSYQMKLSDSGTVYGISNGSVIGWNSVTGRSQVVNQAGTTFSLISSSDNDILLLKGSNASGTKYYTYQAGSGLHQIQSTNNDFVPTTVSFDGTVYGNIPGGYSQVGAPGSLFSKLNADGSVTVDSRAILTYNTSGPMGSFRQTQDFVFRPDGSSVVYGQFFQSTGAGSESTSNTIDIYGNNNTHYQLTNDSSFYGGQSGDWTTSILGDGTAIGYSYNPYDLTQNKVYSSTHPNGVAVDSSFFAPGSYVPDTFFRGNDAYVVGYTNNGDGHQYYSLSKVNTVPEPATMAVLGLGAVGLLRRRRK